MCFATYLVNFIVPEFLARSLGWPASPTSAAAWLNWKSLWIHHSIFQNYVDPKSISLKNMVDQNSVHTLHHSVGVYIHTSIIDNLTLPLMNYKNIGIYIYIYIYVPILTYIHKTIYTYTSFTCMHTYMHACIHTYIHAYIHTYIHFNNRLNTSK